MDLDLESRRHLALRIYDLIQYEDIDYARRYLEKVRWVYARDTGQFGRAATRAAIYNLAKVMVIKDEIYVAHLLTCPEKYARDFERYNVDPARGDRIVYRHLTRPHFRFLGRDFRPDLRTRDWQLRLMRRMKVLRRLFSSWWHREEREFSDWYADLLLRFDYGDEEEYRTWVKVLELPEEVRGYRQVRTPKMAAARQRAEELLQRRPPATAPGLLEIEPVAAAST